MTSTPFFLSSTCSGHGRLEFTPNGSESLFATYCVCDDGYSGLADYFDLRVIVKNGTSPSFEAALDCPISSLSVIIVYAIYFFAYFSRICINLAALRKKVRSYIDRGGSKKFGRAWMFMPFRVLTIDTILSGWHLYTSIGKFIDPASAVLGTSVSVTLAQVVPVFGLTIVVTDYEMATVLSLANIQTWDKFWNTPFTRFYALSCVAAVLVYFVIIVLSLLMTGLDKSNGPIASGQLSLLVGRNVAVVLYWLVHIVMFSHVVYLAKKVREALDTVQSESSPRVNRLITYLEQTASTLRKRVFVAVTAYLIMLIPWTYPYQYIALTIIGSLNGFSGIGTQFLRGTAMMAERPTSKPKTSMVADRITKQQPENQEPQPIPSAGAKASSGTAIITPADGT